MLSATTIVGGNLFHILMTRTVKMCAWIFWNRAGQYNFKECPLVGPQNNVKNSLGVILVSPFKILKPVTKSIFTRQLLLEIPNLTLRAALSMSHTWEFLSENLMDRFKSFNLTLCKGSTLGYNTLPRDEHTSQMP